MNLFKQNSTKFYRQRAFFNELHIYNTVTILYIYCLVILSVVTDSIFRNTPQSTVLLLQMCFYYKWRYIFASIKAIICHLIINNTEMLQIPLEENETRSNFVTLKSSIFLSSVKYLSWKQRNETISYILFYLFYFFPYRSAVSRNKNK